MSKKTQHIIIAAAIGCYFIFLAGMIWYFNRDTQDTQENTTQTDATATDAENLESDQNDTEEDPDVVQSEKLATLLESGLTVQFEGSVLNFPCEYTDILSEEDGWEVHGDGLYDSAVSFGKGTVDYEILLYTPVEGTGDLDTLLSAGCSGIGISLLGSETVPMFTISWITWGDTEEDIRSAFGEPSYINEIMDEEGSVLYTYFLYQAEYNEKTYQLEFVTETETGVVSMDFYYR